MIRDKERNMVHTISSPLKIAITPRLILSTIQQYTNYKEFKFHCTSSPGSGEVCLAWQKDFFGTSEFNRLEPGTFRDWHALARRR